MIDLEREQEETALMEKQLQELREKEEVQEQDEDGLEREGDYMAEEQGLSVTKTKQQLKKSRTARKRLREFSDSSSSSSSEKSDSEEEQEQEDREEESDHENDDSEDENEDEDDGGLSSSDEENSRSDDDEDQSDATPAYSSSVSSAASVAATDSLTAQKSHHHHHRHHHKDNHHRSQSKSADSNIDRLLSSSSSSLLQLSSSSSSSSLLSSSSSSKAVPAFRSENELIWALDIKSAQKEQALRARLHQRGPTARKPNARWFTQEQQQQMEEVVPASSSSPSFSSALIPFSSSSSSSSSSESSSSSVIISFLDHGGDPDNRVYEQLFSRDVPRFVRLGKNRLLVGLSSSIPHFVVAAILKPRGLFLWSLSPPSSLSFPSLFLFIFCSLLLLSSSFSHPLLYSYVLFLLSLFLPLGPGDSFSLGSELQPNIFHSSQRYFFERHLLQERDRFLKRVRYDSSNKDPNADRTAIDQDTATSQQPFRYFRSSRNKHSGTSLDFIPFSSSSTPSPFLLPPNEGSRPSSSSSSSSAVSASTVEWLAAALGETDNNKASMPTQQPKQQQQGQMR